MSRRRSYSQPCPIASALDLLGERWTLLVLRDLILGPLRFTDLLARLPGIGRNLLSRRLHDLESREIVLRSRLEPPAASVVYELTEKGRGLEPVLFSLAEWAVRWGVHNLSDDGPMDADLIGFALPVMFDPARAPSGVQFHEFVADGQAIHVRVGGGQAVARRGRVTDPLIRLTAGSALFRRALAHKVLDVHEAEREGQLKVEGARSALPHALWCYGVEVYAGEEPAPASSF